jgi:hypothetical protein
MHRYSSQYHLASWVQATVRSRASRATLGSSTATPSLGMARSSSTTARCRGGSRPSELGWTSSTARSSRPTTRCAPSRSPRYQLDTSTPWIAPWSRGPSRTRSRRRASARAATSVSRCVGATTKGSGWAGMGWVHVGQYRHHGFVIIVALPGLVYALKWGVLWDRMGAWSLTAAHPASRIPGARSSTRTPPATATPSPSVPQVHIHIHTAPLPPDPRPAHTYAVGQCRCLRMVHCRPCGWGCGAAQGRHGVVQRLHEHADRQVQEAVCNVAGAPR